MAHPPIPIPDKPLNLHLWLRDILVADLLDAFPHQGTWFAHHRQLVRPEQGPVQARLCEYITFCEAWHERLDRGDEPDASEFDRFTDLIESPAWRVRCPGGTELQMAGGPAFVDGQATWNHPDAEPSRELAAVRAWARLTGNG